MKASARAKAIIETRAFMTFLPLRLYLGGLEERQLGHPRSTKGVDRRLLTVQPEAGFWKLCQG